jgi:signal transduction histidine kinase
VKRFVGPAAAVLAVAVTALPIAFAGWPTDVGGQVGAWCAVVGAACLGAWRYRIALVVGPLLLLVPALLGPELPTIALVVLLGYAALIAERFSGRAAWVAGLAVVGYLVLIYAVTGEDSPGVLVLTVPGYLAGTALRLRRQTAEALAERGRELDRERERYTAVAVRNERARIARELHDIVGHALSVMVVQAAAGQRLVDRTPDAARAALDAIADAAHQGRSDLQQLIRLLGGDDLAAPDLALVDEIVGAAARSGLPVSCRIDGRDDVGPAAAHIAFRVVQESLTNALRHAPGAAVRVLLRPVPAGLTVQVENAPPPVGPRVDLVGTGHGLAGLRERVVSGGGSFAAGPTPDGGWRVEAHIAL